MTPEPSSSRGDEPACDGCDRTFSTRVTALPADSAQHPVRLAVTPVGSYPPTGAQAGMGGLADHRAGRHFCGECAAEVRPFAGRLTPFASDRAPVPAAALRTARECSLCAVDLAGAPGERHVLTMGPAGGRAGSERVLPLCAGCADVARHFLETVPGERPAGPLPAPGVDTPEPAPWPDLAERFDALRVGDAVSLRAVAGREDPTRLPETTTVEGRVTAAYATMGIREVAVESADSEGRYLLARPAPTVDRLTLRRAPAGLLDGPEPPERSPEHLGRVVDLTGERTPESEVPAEPSADPERVALDADSALIPDSLDLESSAD